MPYKILSLTGLPGAGKTTLAFESCKRGLTAGVVPCYTTRNPRPSDSERSEYVFLTATEFAHLGPFFFSAARLNEKWYGTLRSDIDQCLDLDLPRCIIASLGLALKLYRAYGPAVRLLFLDCRTEILIQRVLGRERGTSRDFSRIHKFEHWRRAVLRLRAEHGIPFHFVDNTSHIETTLLQLRTIL